MLKKILYPLGFFLLLIALLEGLCRQEVLTPETFPSPSVIGQSLIANQNEFLSAFQQSFFNILRGWLLSVAIGTSAALLFSLSSFLRTAILPFAVFFQTVPIIAIAPLLVIYFGFGDPTVIVSAFIVSVFPVVANTLVGLESATRSQKELFRIYGASPWRTLWKLKIPQAYDSFFTGLRISAGLAIIGAIAGEFVAGGGLGAVIDSARTQQRLDMVYAAILILSLLGVSWIIGLYAIDKGVHLWRPFSQQKQEELP